MSLGRAGTQQRHRLDQDASTKHDPADDASQAVANRLDRLKEFDGALVYVGPGQRQRERAARLVLEVPAEALLQFIEGALGPPMWTQHDHALKGVPLPEAEGVQ